jgi:hypothetical protein
MNSAKRYIEIVLVFLMGLLYHALTGT